MRYTKALTARTIAATTVVRCGNACAIRTSKKLPATKHAVGSMVAGVATRQAANTRLETNSTARLAAGEETR